MLLDQAPSLERSPPAVFWVAVFLTSFAGMFYLGLSPELIDEWYLVLVGFNVVMSFAALYFLVLNMRRLKQNTDQDVIGSKFTWSLVKVIPVLVLLPVLSFYFFSFESIRDNLNKAEDGFDKFNLLVAGEVDELYRGTNGIVNKYYFDRTLNIAHVVKYFDVPRTSMMQIKFVLELLVKDGWACNLKLYDEQMIMLASAISELGCNEEGSTASIGSHTLIVHYSADASITSLTQRMAVFRDAAKKAKFTLTSSIIQNRFMADFSSTVLLAVLTALLVVLRMIDQLMRPMHNLSLATREIAAGNYDVEIQHDPKNTDLHELILHFNEMSRRIKLSREGLDTHNLYLETILKYSFGVIALNPDKTIQLINPVIGKMLQIDNEKIFVGQSYDSITEIYDYLKPLFSYVAANIDKGMTEWAGEIELTLPDRYRLIYCQGASLDVEDNALGYVIMVNDISKLNRAQKKAAWGEVAVRMAHEIKNPLTPILLSAQRLRNLFLGKLGEKDSGIIDKTTSTIIDQVASMDAMVSAFANYANTPEIQRIPFSLNTLVNKAVSLYDAQEGVRIDLDLSGDLPELQLDGDGISRVLINLIKNATEASREKKRLNIVIRTRYRANENIIRLTVTDDGDGFPGEIVDRVFEPYITTKTKGSGLGLAISQNIIEQHDGQIHASNIEPHGARITIEFSIIDGTRSRNG
ncbi:MAG TPA: HAMP domain-containing protein [Candidatus Thioglobus sp.]|nr:HAMP domain-containing protein [Candidatus Thioglobus sp.]